MSFLDDICASMFSPKRPSFSLRPNRVDALPQLLEWQDPETDTISSPKYTELLPIRTKCQESFLKEKDMTYKVIDAQSHAFYEEIHTVPAASMNVESPFLLTKHVYIIHPLTFNEIYELSDLVLNDLKKWIEDSEKNYSGKSKQVLLFKEKRLETLEVVKQQLEKRRRGVTELGDNDGYLGEWEVQYMPGEAEAIALQAAEAEEKAKKDERLDSRPTRSATMTEQGFAQADEMAKKMVENLKALNHEKGE
ncbi:hypothetical protein K504DRAFT_451625 [Pleomassaria siparia CBS 279.74]|uniref:Uncharacterized protein n=1 Tax=Pleomassaria siparia CBS 279.74 TaxID=1314801 RepID=A0A6G1JSZ1_9PLEO|nr:hypothetical protein K504DRAFT_451625 [Pleomassaria siparia CBS 279.74]